MVLKKLKVGMTVYNVRESKGLQRFNGRWLTYPVYIKEIDEENERVLASWNGNKDEWYSKYIWSKWRAKRPID